MYSENDITAPYDRISDETLRKMLVGEYRGNNEREQKDILSKDEMRETWGLWRYPLASVYAPLQEYRGVFDKDTALLKGTLFSELDLPFMGASIANKGGSCRG